MAKKRQVVLMKPGPPDDYGVSSGMEPLGSIDAVKEKLSHFNTFPDGSPRGDVGTVALHGPGMVMEVPTGMDEITQVMVTFIEDEIAWPVMQRLCKAYAWRMLDPDTGRTFG